MKKKVLITGASGFVGTHLVEAAFHLGLEVHAAVRKSSNIDSIKPFVCKFLYPDFSSVENLQILLSNQQYNYIIHAAALTKAKNEVDMLLVNVEYTKNLLSAAFSSDIPLERVVYVSSLAAVGPVGYNDVLITESNQYRPVTVYGRSKRASELMIKELFGEKPISIFRPTAVYGPREKDLFILFNTLNKGFDPYIGRKPQKLSFIYVKDLVDSLLQGCLTPQNGLEYYNITDGHVYSKYAMSDIFRKVMRKRALRFHIPYAVVKGVAELSQSLYKNSKNTPVLYPERLNELTAENWGCDITKLRLGLGFRPSYNLETGLTESLLWYKENNWL